jgi:hypothetical protein
MKEKALAEQAFLFNATIVGIEMQGSEEFDSITVKTVDERTFKFTGYNCEESTIKVEEVE